MGGRLRAVWERRKARAFPDGAITFHLRTWSRRALSESDRSEALALMEAHGFEALYVLHASAFERGEQAIVVGGPPGLGKSRVLFRLAREGHGRMVDDGVVLAGSVNGSLAVVETGALPLLHRAFTISLWSRRLLLIDRSVFSHPAPLASRRRRLTARLLDRVADAALKASVLLPRAGPVRFEPGVLPVARVVLAPHADDSYLSLRLERDGRATPIADVPAALPADVEVLTVSPLGGRPEIARGVRDAVLTLRG